MNREIERIKNEIRKLKEQVRKKSDVKAIAIKDSLVKCVEYPFV